VLHLPGVTLCCIDTANHALALRALSCSRADIRFGRTLFLTHGLPAGISVPDGIDIAPIAPIATQAGYSEFVLKSLQPRITTPHVLLVQWDGYVTHPEAWAPAFLDCDYIGATWHWHDDGMRVGNGGFSLRSLRLLDALQDARITLDGAEDETICRTFRPLLEREYGIRYADEALADRFSFEAAYPVGRPFGFHGLFNFCRVVPPAELATLPAVFSDAIARSLQIRSLLRNCVALAQWAPAAAIARRMIEAAPGDDEARALLAQATAGAAHAPATARNDPCPCGSGRRYKHCHGATGVAAEGAGPVVDTAITADALVARAMEAHQQNNLDAAETDYRAALALAPEHPHALHYLGVILYQRDRAADALPLLERSLALVPQEPEFHNNLGLALVALDRTGEAIAAYRRALAMKPDHAVAWNNLGLALQATNELPGAIDAFRRALAAAPDFAQAHWNLGLALLAYQEFAEGWREYDWRLAIAELGRDVRGPTGPRWDGANPDGKTIVLTSEQGLGDTLQFVRFARDLASRGARVLVQAQPALRNLLASAPGVDRAYGTDDPLPRHDAHLPLLSVAGALGVTAQNIPHAVPYLAPDPKHAAGIASDLAPYRGRLKVGLAWAGSRAHGNDRRRSCPLASLAPLLETGDLAWFSLQKDDGEEQIASTPAARRLILLDARGDFDRKAALMSALDLVISVDTSIAHLAGALARPVWILLPYAPDWRWQLRRSDSPWYPTARLFRQPRAGDWPAVIDELSGALAAWIRTAGCR
jgi:tetratricopeptide (TPR) repeat protein